MRIIFCEDPLNRNQPDELYLAEANAAQLAGLDYNIINFEALVHDQNLVQATRHVPPTLQETVGLYRGWMLKPADYAQLYATLLQKGLRLLNSPAAYQHCHYLPESYEAIKHRTPLSVWLPVTNHIDMNAIMQLLGPFGENPIIVKDYVKSQKHYWREACFIPNASDRELVAQVVERFVELQGDDLIEGLVFRQYVELEPLATHSKSGMPLTKEFRVFVLQGEPLAIAEYWEEGDYQNKTVPLEQFAAEFKAVQSQFYTMDIAKLAAGGWLIIELGDGQVAGLPEQIDVHMFYSRLAEAAG